MVKNETKELIKKAYTYGYPIVGMYELLFHQVISPTAAVTGFHEFSHTAALSTPMTSFVPAPNNDTTYSRAWLDLRGAPVIIETPDTKGRYYSIQLLDLFSETILNIGRRLHGTRAQTFAIVGPNCKDAVPDGVTVVHCKTTFAIAFLRVLIYDQQDIEAVKVIQSGFRLHPMGERKTIDSADFPTYDVSDFLHFFQTLNGVLGITPMIPEDRPILKEICEIGVAPDGQLSLLETMPKGELDAICNETRAEIDRGGLQFGEAVNFWRIARSGIGNYGTNYMQRSVVWYKGALANQPEESLYPSTFQDADGEFLDGHHRYLLCFSKEEIPPVSQFWSLTMYLFQNGFLVENEINRYSIGDRTPGIVYDQSGGLRILIQSQSPEAPQERANWLPAPREKFFMTLRLYGPGKAAIGGAWKPPAVQRMDTKGSK